jgi:lipopolysaccharide heptosyltransferase I
MSSAITANGSPAPLPDLDSLQRILIIRLGALGDVVRTLPALRAIRHRLPRARICWLVEEGSRELLVGHPDLDQLILLPRRELSRELRRPWLLHRGLGRLAGLARRLRAERFDAVFDLHGLLKSGLLARASGAPVRFGFPRELGREGNHRFLTHPLPVPPGVLNRVERLFEMLTAAGIEPRPAAGAGIFPPAEAREMVDRFIEQALPAVHCGSRGLALLAVGSSRQQSWKRWPPDRFAGLALELTRRLPLEVVLSWGPGEQGMAKAVLEAAGSAPRIHLAPPLQLMELAALLDRCHLFVGGDSGPLHLAASMGTAVLGIFGPTDPELNRPLAPGGFRAVHPDRDYHLLSKQQLRQTGGMDEVSVEMVLEAAESMFTRAWAMAGGRVPGSGSPDPPLERRPMEHAAILSGPVEAQVITHLLGEDRIPHLVRRFREIAFDGIFEPQKGWGELLVPAERREEVCTLLELVRAGEGSVEGPDA